MSSKRVPSKTHPRGGKVGKKKKEETGLPTDDDDDEKDYYLVFGIFMAPSDVPGVSATWTMNMTMYATKGHKVTMADLHFIARATRLPPPANAKCLGMTAAQISRASYDRIETGHRLSNASVVRGPTGEGYTIFSTL